MRVGARLVWVAAFLLSRHPIILHVDPVEHAILGGQHEGSMEESEELENIESDEEEVIAMDTQIDEGGNADEDLIGDGDDDDGDGDGDGDDLAHVGLGLMVSGTAMPIRESVDLANVFDSPKVAQDLEIEMGPSAEEEELIALDNSENIGDTLGMMADESTEGVARVDAKLMISGSPMPIHKSVDLSINTHKDVAQIIEHELGPSTEEDDLQGGRPARMEGVAEYLSSSQDKDLMGIQHNEMLRRNEAGLFCLLQPLASSFWLWVYSFHLSLPLILFFCRSCVHASWGG